MYNRSIINKINLPKILQDEEFNYYYKRFLKGNYEALEILVLHNLRLIYWYIEKNINCEEIEYDEIFSTGVEALIESFYSFKSDNGAKFSTYATTCIRNKIFKYLRSQSKHKKTMSLDSLITDSSNSDTFADTITENVLNLDKDAVTMEEKLEERDMDEYYKKYLTSVLSNLNKIDREIINLSFGFYDRVYTQNEISKKMGMSQSQVSKRLSKILKYIKEKIENDKILELDGSIMTLIKKAS